MDWFNIYPARVRLHTVRVESKRELIIIIATVVIFIVLNLLFQKLLPNVKQKTISIISFIPAIIIAFVLIFKTG